MRTVPSSGAAAGFGNIGGFAAAYVAHGTLSVLGFAALFENSPVAMTAVMVLGGGYLILLGCKALIGLTWSMWIDSIGLAQSGPATTASRGSTVLAGFGSGFLTNMLNPKIALFYLAVFPTFIGAMGRPSDAYVLVAIHVAVSVLWFVGVTLLCLRLTRAAAGGIFSTASTALGGLVLIFLGGVVLTS